MSPSYAIELVEVNKSLNHRPSQQCVVWPLLQKEKKIKASMSPCSAPNAGGGGQLQLQPLRCLETKQQTKEI
jgi:hypothetical protein